MNTFLQDTNKAAAHLQTLTYDGAIRKYGFPLSSEVKERIDYELEVICEKYNPNMFLVLHDLVETMRNRGVMVGPGRSRMPSSIVAYCLGITSIDPLKQNFIFEIFLSPDRITLPDLYIERKIWIWSRLFQRVWIVQANLCEIICSFANP